LSSQTTPSGRAASAAAFGRLLVVRTARDPPKWDFPLGYRRARRTSRVATTRSSYATANAQSNNLLDGVFGYRNINERARPRRYSACPCARPASVHAGSRSVGVPIRRRRSWCC